VKEVKEMKDVKEGAGKCKRVEEWKSGRVFTTPTGPG